MKNSDEVVRFQLQNVSIDIDMIWLWNSNIIYLSNLVVETINIPLQGKSTLFCVIFANT